MNYRQLQKANSEKFNALTKEQQKELKAKGYRNIGKENVYKAASLLGLATVTPIKKPAKRIVTPRQLLKNKLAELKWNRSVFIKYSFPTDDNHKVRLEDKLITKLYYGFTSIDDLIIEVWVNDKNQFYTTFHSKELDLLGCQEGISIPLFQNSLVELINIGHDLINHAVNKIKAV